MQQVEGDSCGYCGWSKNKNNEAHQLPVGTVLNNQYEIGKTLGQGGFGITYLGWDLKLSTTVCIKEFFPGHVVIRDCTVSNNVRCRTENMSHAYQAGKERFLREGKLLAQFRDEPEVVSVYSSFEENGTVYIVMEYIRGMNLAQYVHQNGGRLSSEETFRILKPVMEVLARIHRSGLIHRDIAPDNIILHPKGGAKLLDFGAARILESADTQNGQNKSTETIVKHGFAPMEQYQTQGDLGPWTDVYAMCATVFYCLTGRIPPEATTRLMGETKSDWKEIPGLAKRQRYALEKGMAVRPKDRVRSMDELLVKLSGTISTPGEKVNANERVSGAGRKKSSRRLSVATCITAVFALVVIGILPATLFARREDDTVIETGVALQESIAPTQGPADVPDESEITEPIEETETTAPVEETRTPDDQPEAPLLEGTYHVGFIIMDPAMMKFGEELNDKVASSGEDITTEVHNPETQEEAAQLIREMIGKSVDVIYIESTDMIGDEMEKEILAASRAEIYVVLAGVDPSYGGIKYDLIEDNYYVSYVGLDPRVLGDNVAEIIDNIWDISVNKGSGGVDIIFIGGRETYWEAARLGLSSALEKRGLSVEYVGSGVGFDASSVEESFCDTLTKHKDRIDVIICTDAAVAEAVYTMCVRNDIDVINDISIVAVGEEAQLSGLFNEGIIAGYVDYSRNSLVSVTKGTIIDLLQDMVYWDYWYLRCDMRFDPCRTADTAIVTTEGAVIYPTPSEGAAPTGQYDAGEVVKILEYCTVQGIEWGLTEDGWIVMRYVTIQK